MPLSPKDAGYASQGVARIERPFSWHVRQADPDLDRNKRRQLMWEFSNGREFYGDPLNFVRHDFSSEFYDGEYDATPPRLFT